MRGEEPLGPTGLHQCRRKHRTHSQQFGIDNIAECIEEQPISADRLSSERIEFIERKPVRAFPDSPPNPQEFCIDPAELEKDRHIELEWQTLGRPGPSQYFTAVHRSSIVAGEPDRGPAVTQERQRGQPFRPVRRLPPVGSGMAVADNEIGDSAHRADALDQAAVDGVPQPFCSARIFQLAEEQVAEQPDGIYLIGHRKRRQPRQPIGQGAAGHVAVLVDTVGQEMKKGRRRIQSRCLQVGVCGQIRRLVETALFYTADQR